MKTKISADLDRLIKRAAEVKAEGLKKAAEGVSAKLDGAEDGESKATTGSHAADNKAESAKITAPAVDGGGKANPENGSVAKNTDGSEAAATDGSKGPAAGEFPVKSEADNGPTKGEGKYASVRKLANELRAAADGMLSNLDKFLVKSARASTNEKVKTAAVAAPDDEVAAQASDALMEQIAAGQVSDEDAAQILEEALQAGAVTPEELQEAAALVEQAGASGGAPAPAAPAADVAPLEPAAGDVAALPPEEQLKVAAAQIGPDHPKYFEKLAALYPEDMEAGYRFFNKIAEMVIEEEKGEKKEEEEEKKEEEKKEGEEKGEEKKETAPAPAAVATETVVEKPAELVDAMSGVDLKPVDAAEQQALEAVKQELGLNDAQLTELAAAPVPTLDKVAAAKAKYRSAILAKVAALQK